MTKEQVKELLTELAEKGAGLDEAAQVLWQTKRYIDAMENQRYALGQNVGADEWQWRIGYVRRMYLQLDHYLTVYNIKSINSKDLKNEMEEKTGMRMVGDGLFVRFGPAADSEQLHDGKVCAGD